MPKVILFALTAVYTMVFPPEEFSVMTTWYVYAAFINIILTLGLETSFFRFFTAEKDKKSIISTSFTLLLISSGIFLLIGYLFSNGLSSFFKFDDNRFLPILLWVTVLDTLTVIPFAYLRVTGKSLRFLIVKTANIVILAIVTVFLLLIVPRMTSNFDSGSFLSHVFPAGYKPEVFHIFVANVMASFFTLVIMTPELRNMRIQWDKEIVKKLMNYGLPIMVGGIAYAVNEHIDKLMIPEMMDKTANGIYAACYKLGVFMTLYVTAFRLGAEPFFFNQAKFDDAKEKYSTIMTGFVAFGSVFMILVVMFIDPLSSVILKQKAYTEGLIIVPIILLANLFSGVYNNLAVWYKLTDKTKFGMYISMFGGVLTIVNLLIFIPPFGIIGAAYATLVTYFSMAVISWYFGRTHYHIPYDLKRLGVIIVITAVISLLSFHIFRGQIFMNLILFLTYLGAMYFILKNVIQQVIRE